MMTYVDMQILLHNYIYMGFVLRLVPQVHIYIPYGEIGAAQP